MDTAQKERFDELKAKSAGAGLTDDEATELGKLFALDEGAEYSNAATEGDTERMSEEEKERQMRDQMVADEQWHDMDQRRSRVSFKEGGVDPGSHV